MTRDEELALIKRVRDGDKNAFEALVVANQKQIYNLALRMVGNEHDASDISQESFLRAYKSLGDFRGDSKFSVWLYRLTSNVCIDFLRSRKRWESVPLSVSDDEDEERELDIPDERFAPESELQKKELRAAIARALQALPEEHRRILTLRELGGLSYEELGRALSLEPGTVKSRLSRARKKLCAFLLRDGNITDAWASNEIKEV